MPNLDAFSAQLVDFVRRMSDDALLALVRAQLGSAVGAITLPQVKAALPVAKAPARRAPVRAAKAKRAAAPAPVAPAAPAPAKALAKPGPAKAMPKAAPVKKAPAAKKAAAKVAPKPAAKVAPKAPAKVAPKASAPKGKPAKAAPKGKPAKAGRRGSAAGRAELLTSVERIVKASSGVSASEVAKSAGVPQSRASSALKELKLAKRIFQGGDRRFARYAGDARTALGASDTARRSASGPVLKKRR